MTASLSAHVRTLLDPAAFFNAATGWEAQPWQRDALHALRRGDGGMLCASRQCGKTELAAVAATDVIARLDDATALVLAPSRQQAAELVRKAKRCLRRVGPTLGLSLSSDNVQSLEVLPTRSRIVVIPDDPDLVRSYSATLLIVDEAAYVSEASVNAARPTLAATGGSMLAISTPRSATGWFAKEWARPGVRLRITADQVPWFSQEFLNGERERLGADGYAREYEGAFVVGGGGYFNMATVAAAFDPSIRALRRAS